MKDTMTLDGPRAAEVDKYVQAYQHPGYRMGAGRLRRVTARLEAYDYRGSLLDVGTGRGELLSEAKALGYSPVLGTEVVPELLDEGQVVFAMAHALPWHSGAWDVVCCCDVLEHLVPGDTEEVLFELSRVASRLVVITAASYSHVFQDVELHVNRRPESEWDRLIKTYCPGRRYLRVAGDRELWVIIR